MVISKFPGGYIKVNEAESGPDFAVFPCFINEIAFGLGCAENGPCPVKDLRPKILLCPQSCAENMVNCTG